MLIPARVIYFGAAIQGAGRSRVIMYGALVNLLINGVLSSILVHYVGYNGAIISTILCVYALNFGYLSYFISKYYDVGFSKVFPVKEIILIMIGCSIAAVSTFPYMFLNSVSNSHFMVLSSVILYIVLCMFILFRMRFISNPVLWVRQKWEGRE